MERRPGVADPFLQVSSYGSHIGHEANRVLKNVLVDSLEHIFGSRVGLTRRVKLMCPWPKTLHSTGVPSS